MEMGGSPRLRLTVSMMTRASARPWRRVLMTSAMDAAGGGGGGAEPLLRGSVSMIVVTGVCSAKKAAAAGVELMSSYCRTRVVILA